MTKLEEVLENAILAFKNRTKLSHFRDDQLAVYDINSVFKEQSGEEPGFHSYWCNQLRGSRFATSSEQGNRIIYRPTVTNEIVQEIDVCFRKNCRQGLMIKGPPGIGKSHSMVNVYRKLVTSSDKYLVTFIPYCKNWRDEYDFLDAVCQSLGIKYVEDLGLDTMLLTTNVVRAVCREICHFLRKYDLKWVFMFDQIDALFDKDRTARTLPELKESFSLVDTVLEANLVVSVIAVSTTDQIANQGSHKDFKEYLHCPRLAKEELELFVNLHRTCTEEAPAEEAFAAKADTVMAKKFDKCKKLMQITGGVPLYAYRYLQNPGHFMSNIEEEVLLTLEQLRKQNNWPLILETLISSLLLLPTNSSSYDRQHFLQSCHGSDQYKYAPLFPAIAAAFRNHLWDDLFNAVRSRAQIGESAFGFMQGQTDHT